MKKICAYWTCVILFAVAILTYTSPTEAEPAQLDLSKISLQILNDAGKATTSTSLERNSIVTLAVNLKLPQVYELKGTLDYDSEVFEEVTLADVVPGESGWETCWEQTNRQLSVTPTLDDPVNSSNPFKDANGVVVRISLKVKKAAAHTTFSLRNLRITDDQGSYQNDVIALNVANSENSKRKVTLATENNPGVPAGGVLTVPIRMSANSGFNMIGLTIEYDSSILNYQSVELSKEAKAYTTLISANKKEDGTTGVVRLSTTTSFSDNVHVGDFLFLNFNVSEDSVGNSVDVKATINMISNFSELDMSGKGTFVISTNTITDPIQKGDVNEDGSIDLIDATYLLQYYNGVRTLSDSQVQYGDVNHSGSVTLVDVLLIMRKYNGEDLYFS